MKRIFFLLLVTICTIISITTSKATIPSPIDDDTSCPIAGGTIFVSTAGVLNGELKNALNSLVADMLNNPSCKVVVIGGGKGNKLEQQASWENVNAVINYLVEEKRIDRERFIFMHSGYSSVGTVDYRAAGENEDGPSSVPQPFPGSR